MFTYYKSLSNIEYLVQNIEKYRTHKMYTQKLNTTQLVCDYTIKLSY